jgi:hypothetical protein
LRLAPTWTDLRPCPYPIRIIATDTGNLALTDTVSLQVKILIHDVFMPLVIH